MRCATALTLLTVFSVAACKTTSPAPPSVPQEPLVETTTTTQARPAFMCEESDVAWPMFQRSKMRHGATNAPPIRNPQRAWSREIGIASWLNNPIVANDRVFAPSSGAVWNAPDGLDGVHAFDLKTGAPAWFTPAENDVNSIAYEHCRVFVSSDDGSASALDAATGEVLWRVEFGAKMYSVVPLGDRVIVGGERLVALEVSTGNVLWQTRLSGAVRAGAAADDSKVYVTTDDAAVYAVRINNGDVVWRQQINADDTTVSAYGAPTLVGKQIYIPFVRDTYYNTPALWALDLNGNFVWEASNPNDLQDGWANVRSSPAFHDGNLYWGEAYSNRLASLDATSGEAVSSTALGVCTFPHWPSPAIAQHLLYLPRHDGTLYAYDITSGKVTWQIFIGDGNRVTRDTPPENLEAIAASDCVWEPPYGAPVFASPAVASDGAVVVSTGDGWLHVINESPSN